jgi:hypothetical protein
MFIQTRLYDFLVFCCNWASDVYKYKINNNKKMWYILFHTPHHYRQRMYNTSFLLLYIFRTSGNQNIRQDKIDGESEENAVPGDLRHGIDTSSKRYSVKLAICIHRHVFARHCVWYYCHDRNAIHSRIILLFSIFIFLRLINI